MTMLVERPHELIEPGPLADESDRYRIYILVGHGEATRWEQRQLADSSLDGIGTALRVLRNEHQITNDDRVGIFDRVQRKWLVNPYGVGR